MHLDRVEDRCPNLSCRNPITLSYEPLSMARYGRDYVLKCCNCGRVFSVGAGPGAKISGAEVLDSCGTTVEEREKTLTRYGLWNVPPSGR